MNILSPYLEGGNLVINPHFLSVTLFKEFLDLISPLRNHLGMVMLQFEYLNRQKIAGLGEFLDKLGGSSMNSRESIVAGVSL